jgi:hypothetical protein
LIKDILLLPFFEDLNNSVNTLLTFFSRSRNAFGNLVTKFLIEVRENSRDNSAARRLPARLNASEETMPTAALEEAEGAAASNYSSGSIVGKAVTLVF